MTHALRLGVVSDLHYVRDGGPGLAYHNPFDVPGVLARLAAAIDWFGRERVDALVLAGDLSDDGERAALMKVLGTVAERWRGPTFAVAGNHDRRVHDDALAEVLRHRASDRIVLARPEGVLLGGVRVAGPCDRPFAWTEATAAWADDPVVLISHYPMLSRAHVFAEHGYRYAGDRPDHRSARDALRARRAPTIVVHGHLHARDSYRCGTLLQLSVAALVEPPFEATIIDVVSDRTTTSVRRRARSLADDLIVQAPVLAPADETATLRASTGG